MVEQLAARDALDKLPPAIMNAPELRIGLALFYHAFWDLDTCRTVGMGEGPISWLSVDAYATARGLDEEQRADMHHHITAMDRAYLKHRAEQREKESKRGRGKSQSGVVCPPNQKGRKRR